MYERNTYQVSLYGNEININRLSGSHGQQQSYLMFGIPISRLRKRHDVLGPMKQVPKTIKTTIDDFVDA